MRVMMSLLFLLRKYLCLIVAPKCAGIARLNTMSRSKTYARADSINTSVSAKRSLRWKPRGENSDLAYSSIAKRAAQHKQPLRVKAHTIKLLTW